MDTPPRTRDRLSREAIVSATLRVLDERGVTGVSMRAVAARLGCEAMSLYGHVPSKAALLDLVGDAVLSEIRVPDCDGTHWEACLFDLFREYRRVALEHPAAFELLAHRPLTDVGLEPLEAGMRALSSADLGTGQAARALCVLLAFSMGAIGNELAAHRTGGALAGAIPAERLEEGVLEHAREFVQAMGAASYEAEFEYGLEVIVRGLGGHGDASR